jgi:hypothetical protein
MQVAMLHYSDRPIYELWKINNQPTLEYTYMFSILK